MNLLNFLAVKISNDKMEKETRRPLLISMLINTRLAYFFTSCMPDLHKSTYYEARFYLFSLVKITRFRRDDDSLLQLIIARY